MRNVAQIEQHFVYLSVNNNTHIKKTLHRVLQSIFFWGQNSFWSLLHAYDELSDDVSISQPNICLKVLTKLQVQKIYRCSTSKSLTKIYFKIMIKH